MPVYFPDPLGHDVGRAVGAASVNAGMSSFHPTRTLFCRPPTSSPFFNAVGEGLDIALNDLEAISYARFAHPHCQRVQEASQRGDGSGGAGHGLDDRDSPLPESAGACG